MRLTAVRAGGLLAAGLALAVVAFAVPSLAASADPGGLSPERAAMIRTGARHTSRLPPLAMEVVDVSTAGGLRLERLPRATVRWETIFGVPFATTEVSPDGSRTQVSAAWAIATWVAFISGEVGVAVLFVRELARV